MTTVQSTKVKVSTAVYIASKSMIEEESMTWKERHLLLHIYPDNGHRFTTLKIEGSNAKELAIARKSLDKILSGVTLTSANDQNAIWSSSLSSSNGPAYKKLKAIEKELYICIARDKSKRQLQYHGPPSKFLQAADRISKMLEEESSTSFEIDLNQYQFTWMIHGGFRSVKQELGENVAVFDVVSRKTTINGTQEQYETTLAMMKGLKVTKLRPIPDGATASNRECPICLSEAETPIQTSCTHTYCLDCFENSCKAAASNSKDEFRIKCEGDEGKCGKSFSLLELKEHVSSIVFEIILESSFKEFIKRHPKDFHYCPTPDCGYIYRCTPASNLKPPSYTCPNCFERLCTSCHAKHGDYTCTEYKDIQSGGYEALERLKKEFNIKDCPKCKTPMEKTEGCNHMAAEGYIYAGCAWQSLRQVAPAMII